jgi:hypothetical protein
LKSEPALARIVLANNSPGLVMRTLPGGGSRWLNRLIDEQDVTLFALRPLQADGMVTPAEMENIYPAFQELYRAMRAREEVMPSPFLATYLGWQRPSALDALFIYPDDDQSPLTAVVFLHGFSGNFTYQCWLVGQARRAASVLTVCPSTRWTGDWWSEAGEAMARAYTAAAGERATYVEMTGDHFLLAKNPAETQALIAGWPRRRAE